MSGVIPAVSFSIVRKHSILVPRASSSSLGKMIHTHCTSSFAFSQPHLLLRHSSETPATSPPEFSSTPSYEPDVPPEIPGPPTAPEVQPIPPEFPADPPPNSPGPNPGPELPRPPIPSPPGPEVPSPGKEIPWPDPEEPVLPQLPEILPPKPPKHWTADPLEVQPPPLQGPPELHPEGPYSFWKVFMRICPNCPSFPSRLQQGSSLDSVIPQLLLS